jgi:outer membrane immunogenic protein
MNLKPLLLVPLMLTPFASQAAGVTLAGPYVGIYAGYVDGKDDGGWSPGNGLPSSWTVKTTPKGGVYGLMAGDNWIAHNKLLYGIEADFEGRSADDSTLEKLSGSPVPDFPFKTELKYAASLRAKLGYSFNEKRTAIYVTGGYAGAKIKRYHEPNPDFRSDSNWQNGWTAGLGAEHLLRDNLSLKIEYRFADYGKETFPSIDGGATHYELDYKENTLRLGVAYRF